MMDIDSCVIIHCLPHYGEFEDSLYHVEGNLLAFEE